MFLSVPVSLFYAQLESNYRLYLETLFDDFLFTLTVYTVCRALLSITMQIPLVKWTEGLNIKTIVSISYVCYAVAAIGFAFFFIDLLGAFDCGFIYGGRKHASESHANLCLAPCSQSYTGRIFCIFRPALGYFPDNWTFFRRDDLHQVRRGGAFSCHCRDHGSRGDCTISSSVPVKKTSPL